MKTPKEFNALLKRGILTTEIIASVLYSFNKRAKNLKMRNRDQYRIAKKKRNLAMLGGRKQDSKTENENRIIEYYRKKDLILLSLFRPSKIHIIDGEEFLFYRVYRSEFHFPLYMYEIYGKELPGGLEKIEINDFDITGEPVGRLLSVQFCDKVVDIIQSGRFILIEGGLLETTGNGRISP